MNYLDFLNVNKLNKQYTGRNIKVAIIEDYIKEAKEHYFIINSTKEVEHSKNVAETILSIAPNCYLYNIVIDTQKTDIEQIKKAIKYCISLGVDIINMSLTVLNPDAELMELISIAKNKGIVIIVASGNSSKEVDDPFINSNSTISVGAMNEDCTICSYSNYGSIVDCYSLGEIDLGDTTFYGTSCSTPIVSGIIALLKEQNPNLTVREIRSIIKENSENGFLKAFKLPYDYRIDGELFKEEINTPIKDVKIYSKDIIKVGEVIKPTFDIIPNVSDVNDIILTSNNENIAKVNVDNSIVGLKSGSCNFTINILKNNFSKNMTIKVADEIDELLIECLSKYNVDELHGMNIKGEGIKVAILDSGVNKVGNIDEVIYAPNFIYGNPTNSKLDNYGQGTITASVVKSIAPNCTLYSLKNQNGGGYSYLGEQKQLQSLQWCIDNKIDIVIARNLLMGIYDSKNTMFKKMNEAGIITIVKQVTGDAARFDKSNTEDNLCVALLNNDNTPFVKENQSNLDVACYYAGFPTYTNNGKLEITSTQNMGASLGIVGGICALLKEQDKDLSVTKLRKLLPDLCTPIGDKGKFGYGILKAKLLK